MKRICGTTPLSPEEADAINRETELRESMDGVASQDSPEYDDLLRELIAIRTSSAFMSAHTKCLARND